MERPAERRGSPFESCAELAGESPVRVSAGAPGSRVRTSRESAVSKRTDRSPCKGGATERVATSREACSLVRSSAERRMVGPSRSCHGEGNRQQRETGAAAGPTRGMGRDTFRQLSAEQERPSSVALRQGRDPAYKATPKWFGSREGVRGARSTADGGANKPLEGRGPALVVRDLEVSARAWL
jgi:hypothetical protein